MSITYRITKHRCQFYFGGENIIYGIKGYEVKHKSYETFFPKLSGQKIYHVKSYEDLIKKVKSYVK